MPKTWIYHPELKQRLWLSVEDNIWPKKFRLFAEKILGLDGTISVRRAAMAGNVNRKTAGRYLAVMEKNDLLMSTLMGLPSRKVYVISEGTLLENLETLIRNRPGYLRERYRYVCELIGRSLNEILPFLDVWLEESKKPL